MNNSHYELPCCDEQYLIGSNCEDLDIKQEIINSIPEDEKKEIEREDHIRRANFNSTNYRFYQNLSKGRHPDRGQSDVLDQTIIESNNTIKGWNNAKNGPFPGQARYRNEKCDPDVYQLDDYKEAPTHSFGTKKYFHSLHDYLHKP